MNANSRPVTKLASLSSRRSKNDVPIAVKVCATKNANAIRQPIASTRISVGVEPVQLLAAVEEHLQQADGQAQRGEAEQVAA